MTCTFCTHSVLYANIALNALPACRAFTASICLHHMMASKTWPAHQASVATTYMHQIILKSPSQTTSWLAHVLKPVSTTQHFWKQIHHWQDHVDACADACFVLPLFAAGTASSAMASTAMARAAAAASSGSRMHSPAAPQCSARPTVAAHPVRNTPEVREDRMGVAHLAGKRR